MKSERPSMLKERIKHLQELKSNELVAATPSQSYIDDLNDSIAGCKRELAFLNKNPSGVEFVNGV